MYSRPLAPFSYRTLCTESVVCVLIPSATALALLRKSNDAEDRRLTRSGVLPLVWLNLNDNDVGGCHWPRFQVLPTFSTEEEGGVHRSSPANFRVLRLNTSSQSLGLAIA
ncbi:hypothetical protein B0I37DRAFT_29726 [Chaetomium sp. MPI-CAGE-AT-0009]|nr:hypothetical protein B0I37DRAFT_29726 [Chaetomium sp. MPI-CAGE-AT-0009]